MPLFKRKTHESEVSAPEVEAPRWSFEPVEEISPEWLNHMVKVWGQEKGKFIRIGDNLVLVAASRAGGEGPTHKAILEHTLKSDNPELKDRIVGSQAVAAASGENLLDASGIRDAGRFVIEPGSEGKIKIVTIEGESAGYGKAYPEGRAHTVEVVKQKLGSDIEVVDNDQGTGVIKYV